MEGSGVESEATVLRELFGRLKHRVESRTVSRQSANVEFTLLREKLDKLFASAPEQIEDMDAEIFTQMCLEINGLGWFIDEESLHDESVYSTSTKRNEKIEVMYGEIVEEEDEEINEMAVVKKQINPMKKQAYAAAVENSYDEQRSNFMFIPSEKNAQDIGGGHPNIPKTIRINQNSFQMHTRTDESEPTAAVDITKEQYLIEQNFVEKGQPIQAQPQVNVQAKRQEDEAVMPIEAVLSSNRQSVGNKELTIAQSPKASVVVVVEEIPSSRHADKELREKEKEQVVTFTQKLERHMILIRDLFADKQLDNLRSELNELEEVLTKSSGANSVIVEQFRERNEKEIRQFADLCSRFENSVMLLGQKEGWKLEKVTSGMAISYKEMAGSKMIALRMEATDVDIELRTLIAIIYEIELYKDWLPFCNNSANLKTVDDACKIVYLKSSPPFISDREAYVHGMGVDRLKQDGSIYIIGRSIDKDLELQKECGIEIPLSGKCVRIDIPFLTFQIKPQSAKKLGLSLLVNFDAHLKFLPDSIINLFIRKFAKFLFSKMLEQQKKFKGSKWEKNVAANPKFYDWILGKANLYLESKQEK